MSEVASGRIYGKEGEDVIVDLGSYSITYENGVFAKKHRLYDNIVPRKGKDTEPEYYRPEPVYNSPEIIRKNGGIYLGRIEVFETDDGLSVARRAPIGIQLSNKIIVD